MKDILPYAKDWGKRSAEEINRVKKEHCQKHKCPYLKKSLSCNVMYVKGACFCDYLCMTGHMRGCAPEDCTHWKDEVIKDESKGVIPY